MSEILSQAEIDELMRAIAIGETDDKDTQPKESIKHYDFKTANRFTKEQIRAINVVFKNFGHLLSNYLMGTLRATCEAEVLSIEEMPFNEFNNSVPSPVIIAIVNMAPLAGSVILEMSKEISYSIMSRVLGGTKEISVDGRQFTEIELAIMERVLWQLLKNLDEAWAKMIVVNSTLDKIETSMQFAQIVDMNEPVLLVTINITIGKESGLMGFCLPHQALEPFIKKLNRGQLYTNNAGKKIVSHPESMINSIINTDVTITSVFNSTAASVKDIMSLDVGDVIQLQHNIDEPLIVKLQHIPKFRASLGKFKNNAAVKILDVIRREEENE